MSKKNVRKSSYVAFERKMTRKMLSMMLIAVGIVFLLRELIRGRFGDAVVDFLGRTFFLDYKDALYIYQATFRNHLGTIICIAIIIALLAVFRYSIRWVTEYFDEISAGCDALLDEKSELITLSPEMGFLELKLNECKNILEKRDRDARQAEQRKNDLVVYLAHDIRTPLTSVIGYLELMGEAPDLPVEQRAKYLCITLDKAYRLEQLINPLQPPVHSLKPGVHPSGPYALSDGGGILSHSGPCRESSPDGGSGRSDSPRRSRQAGPGFQQHSQKRSRLQL